MAGATDYTGPTPPPAGEHLAGPPVVNVYDPFVATCSTDSTGRAS